MTKRKLSNDFSIDEILHSYKINNILFFNILQHLKVNHELFIGNDNSNAITISKTDIDSVKLSLDLIKKYYIKLKLLFLPWEKISSYTFYFYAVTCQHLI